MSSNGRRLVIKGDGSQRESAKTGGRGLCKSETAQQFEHEQVPQVEVDPKPLSGSK